ncbi:SIR2 family NAD-dependent protein deacylase [Calorimonas adulescens]|uniref:NAD-dependent protein deacetylase n=1 Tax=Calorimonas adulescens TaxID=2606906 RepID=A0A5D8QET8_9THEO|nr:NAD-dependent protein deacylase [Calorimonas adulescens]TZE81758.1 NAD-dependent protein deacylase [Calorimonas adulescens]
MDNIKKACELIINAKYCLALTGAGISTESGIPDFRSPGTGLWEKMDPMEALSTDVLYGNPEKFYREGFNILRGMRDVQPNTAHRVLAWLEECGYIKGVITQNIDNLHQKAGSKKVYEVHGNTRTCHCTRCKSNFDFQEMERQIDSGVKVPKCEKCGAMLRPDVVMFGDPMPRDFDIAIKEAEKCDVLLVIGSSLEVAPVCHIPGMVPHLIIINLLPTPYDKYADVVFHEKAGVVMDNIRETIQNS